MTNKLPENLFFDQVKATEIPATVTIEVKSYPEDEAGTLEGFTRRQIQAPDLFLGAYIPPNSELANTSEQTRSIIAYICSTRSNSPVYTHECMSRHDPDGASVCIHSVCVSSEHRRKGLALAMLNEYVKRVRGMSGVERILLIAHENLCQLYQKAGFEWIGQSAVVHGSEKWYEMKLSLVEPANAPTLPSSISPQTLIELLKAPRTRPTGLLLSSFSSLDEVCNLETETKTNKYDLLCPREGCGSVILKGGVAPLVEKESSTLEPPEQMTSRPYLPPLPNPPESIQCWLVRPSPMVFENVGFSRAITQETNGPRLKLLICADCDVGPLGWCIEGGSDYWVIANRVSYRVS